MRLRKREHQADQALFDQVERALPAGSIEDMQSGGEERADARAEICLLLIHLSGGGLERPVVEQGPAKDVFARHEAPVAAIEGVGAVVPHGKDLAGRHDKIAIDDVVGQVFGPDFQVGWRAVGGKVVASRLVGVLRIFVVLHGPGVGLVLGDAVEVDDAVREVEVVAGNGDDALDEDQVGGLRIGL